MTNTCAEISQDQPPAVNDTKILSVNRSLLFLTAFFALTACTWTSGVFEKNLDFKDHEWLAAVKPDISFDITDTVSLNNMYMRATVREPGERQGRTGDYDLQLATNGKGWIGTAMDDIYDTRLLIQPGTKFRKAGTYHITLEQLMREDPLRNVLSAGLRIERVQ